MEPKDFFRVIWRRKRTAITALVVVVGVALFGSLQRAPLYSAACKVRIAAVGPAGGSQISNDPKQNPTEIYASFEEMQAILEAPTMASKVADDLHVPYSKVAGSINASHEANTGIFDLTVVGGDPKFDVTVCNQYMVRFLKERVDGATAKVQASEDLKNQHIQTDEDQIKGFETQLSSAAKSGNQYMVDQLKLEIEGLSYDITTTNNAKTDLETALRVGLAGGGEVVAPAGYANKVGPNHMRDGLLGLIAGAIFGAALALAREYMDDTVRDKEAAQRDLGLPVLASLPSGRSDGAFGGDDSGSLEAARMLRTTLASQGLGSNLRCMVVTSTLAKRSPTALAALAAAIAEAGRTVLVIGADFRNPRTHEVFGVGNAVGLTNVIRGQVTFDKAIRPVPGQVGVYVMPSGPVMGNPGELLSTEEMAMVVRRARKWADIVLIDAPPVLAAADASVLGTYSDGVLLVMSAGQTLRSQANEAKEQLKAAGAHLLGAVMFGAADNGKVVAIAPRRDDYLPPLSPYGGGFDDGYGFNAEPYADYDTVYETAGYEYEDEEYDDGPVVARARTSTGSKRKAPEKKKKKGKTVAASAPARVRREDATMTKAPMRKAVARKAAGVPSRAPKRVAAKAPKKSGRVVVKGRTSTPRPRRSDMDLF
ncbi:MAG: tyrosine-protein kinase domain-containing protein [Actinomycetota bacterium]